MRTSPRVMGAAACGVAVLVSGCTSSTADPGDGVTEAVSPVATSSPSATEDPSPTVSASPDDPFAVPDPVTEEYVDRVVNTIYEEWGAITREILEQPADPSGITDVETRERIAALFGGQYLQQRFAEADDMLRGDREALLPPEEFDQLRIRTRQIKEATDTCMVVAADIEFSGTAVDGDAELAALSLQPVPSSVVGWEIIDVVRARGADGERLPDAAILDNTIDDLEAVLDNACTGEGPA